MHGGAAGAVEGCARRHGRGRRRRWRRSTVPLERPDSIARQRPAKIRHRPPALENGRRRIVDVVHQEDALLQPRQDAIRPLVVEPAVDPREPLEHPQLVPLRLQPAEQPGPGIREPLVVEVDRVLGREQDAEADRPPLLQQREERLLRGRVRDRREVSEDLVHVEDGAQARGPALPAHPAHRLVEQQRDEEHPLGVAEVRDRADRDARLAVRGIEQRLQVERLAFQPGLEPRRGQHAVQPHRHVEAVLRREVRLEIDDANLVEGRGLHAANQRGQIHVDPALPGMAEERGDQAVLTAARRRVHAREHQGAGGRARRALGDPLGIVPLRRRRCGERAEDRDRAGRPGCPA